MDSPEAAKASILSTVLLPPERCWPRLACIRPGLCFCEIKTFKKWQMTANVYRHNHSCCSMKTSQYLHFKTFYKHHFYVNWGALQTVSNEVIFFNEHCFVQVSKVMNWVEYEEASNSWSAGLFFWLVNDFFFKHLLKRSFSGLVTVMGVKCCKHCFLCRERCFKYLCQYIFLPL